jgi:hypothetical protein
MAAVPAAAVVAFGGTTIFAATANAATDPGPYGRYQGGAADPGEDQFDSYDPSNTQTGPNSAAAPRTSESQTSQNEACGANPGENDHTLSLPKIVNLNMC